MSCPYLITVYPEEAVKQTSQSEIKRIKLFGSRKACQMEKEG